MGHRQGFIMRALRILLGCVCTLCWAHPLAALSPKTDDDMLREWMWQRFIALPAQDRPAIGLALSAGGVRGFAHVGVLEVFTNAQLPVDKIAGTSMGAVVGGLYAAGLPTEKLWDLSNHITIDTITPDFNARGLLRFIFERKLPTSSNLSKFFENQLGDMQFEDMPVPFACSAMDVKTGERVLFNSGPLAIAVRASMNLPGVFEPVPYRHRALVDGAVVDYLPVETVKQMGVDYVIASVTPFDFSSKTPTTVLGYVNRVNDVRAAAMIEESARKANFVITNRVLDTGTLELNKLHRAGEVGVKETYKNLPRLQEDLVLYALPYIFTK